MALTDLDLTRRRLTIAGVTRELDELGHQVLTRLAPPPATAVAPVPQPASPRLPISAHGAQPISDTYLKDLFRDSGVTLDRLRMDRNLEEALVYGPDPLHLAALCGLSEATAIRYTNQARRLLAPPADAGSD